MSETSPARIKVKGINQIGIVVKNLQRTMENYWHILGIGPWEGFPWEAPLVYDRTYHGKPAWARDMVALVQVGSVQLELCQPVEGDSVYKDFLAEHREGLHHLNFLVDDVDETTRILEEQGFPCLQSGHYGPPEKKCGFSYIDTKPLRTIWEPVHRGEKAGAQVFRYPEDPSEISPAKVRVEDINKVGIVVKDLHQVIESYWNILGIGPWEVFSREVPLVYDRRYHGKPAWTREKIAKVQVGGVQLELCQPVEGDSIYRDFLAEHGEGLHHLSLQVDDVDETSDRLIKDGYPSIQSARFASEDKYPYNYVDIKPLHTIWEVVQKVENMGVEPVH